MQKRVMSDKMYRQWCQEIFFLKRENLITLEQEQTILSVYEPLPSRSKEYFLVILTSLGVLMLGFAIFLVVSFNWQEFLPLTKMTITLGSLFVSYLIAGYFRYNQWNILSEIVCFGGLILYGVNIWQISQVFNVDLAVHEGLFLWVIGGILLACFLKLPLTHLLITVLLVLWLLYGVIDGDLRYYSNNSFIILGEFYLIPLLVAVGVYWAHRQNSIRTKLYYLLVLFLWFCVQPLFHSVEESFPWFFAGVGGLFFAGSKIARDRQTKLFCSVLGLPLLLFVFLYFGYYRNFYYISYSRNIQMDFIALDNAILHGEIFLLIAALFFVYRNRIKKLKKKDRLSFMWICSPDFLALLFMISPWILCLLYRFECPLFTTILSNIMTLMACYYLLHQGRQESSSFCFITGTVVFVIYAIWRYIDLFGRNNSMLTSAIFFVLLAIILFACAYFWYRLGRRENDQKQGNLTQLEMDSLITQDAQSIPGTQRNERVENNMMQEREGVMERQKNLNRTESEENLLAAPRGSQFGKKSCYGVLLAILVQFGILGTMLGMETIPFLNAREITVETEPVDPRDLFRGDYIILHYSFNERNSKLWKEDEKALKESELDESEQLANDRKGTRTVYTEFKFDEKRDLYTPIRMGYQRPNEGFFIKGTEKKLRHSGYSINYGIEKCFVQEGTGRQWEQATRSRTSSQKLRVRLLIAESGQAQIKKIELSNTNSGVTAPEAVKNQSEAQKFQLYAQGLPSGLMDWHIHLRGGMTAKKALERYHKTGVYSGVLENTGRDWPLSDNDKLKKFIEDVEKVNKSSANAYNRLYIGVQVNDRDWYKTIDLKLYHRLDYILADTMIMGTTKEGNPQKLWLLPPDYNTDKDKWFAEYLEHNLRILDEPITILANPTYLPKFIAKDYDKYWTDENMKKIIDKAVTNNVALEIQAESDFPKKRFVDLAKKAGAKFTFGSNNFDDKLKNLDTWRRAFKEFGLTQKENIKKREER